MTTARTDAAEQAPDFLSDVLELPEHDVRFLVDFALLLKAGRVTDQMREGAALSGDVRAYWAQVIEAHSSPSCPFWCTSSCEAEQQGPHFGPATELVTTAHDGVILRVRRGEYDPEPGLAQPAAVLLELECTALVDAIQRAVLSPEEARALASTLLAVADETTATSHG